MRPAPALSPFPHQAGRTGRDPGARPPARSPRKAGSLVLPSMSATSSCLPEHLSSHGESCVPMNPTSRRVPAENAGPTLGTRKGMGGTESRERNTSAPLVVTAFLCHPPPGRQSAPVEGRPSLHPRGTGSPCPSPPPRPPGPLPFHPALCLSSYTPVTPVLTTGLGLLVPSFF